MDDCVEYVPRVARRLLAQQYIERVHQQACWLGFRFGIVFTLWIAGMVGMACWLACQ